MIQLLNGETHDTEVLLSKMNDDDFYYNYLGQNALSSSSIKDLLDSPKTYHFRRENSSKESQALRDGWLAHTCILEPEVFSAQEFIDVQSKNTKAFREAKANNPKVFTMKEKNDAERVADAFLRNEKALSYLKGAEFEVPVIGQVDGYPFRGKADILGPDFIADIKTTTDVKGFNYSAAKYHYDVQCYLYCNLFGVNYDKFTFIIIDKGSLDIGIAHCSEEFYISGYEKVKKALATYQTFFEDGVDIDSFYLEMTL